MKTADKLRLLHSKDQSLRWTTRVVGFILLAASLFFMTRDITQTTTTAVWFFALSSVLGGLTLVTSWLPGPKKTQLQERRVVVVPRWS